MFGAKFNTSKRVSSHVNGMDTLSVQRGKHRHVSKNTPTLCRVGRQPSTRFRGARTVRKPMFKKSGFLKSLVQGFFYQLGWRKDFLSGISKTGLFTLTQIHNESYTLFVIDPDNVLYVPPTMHGMDGIVCSVKKGDYLTEGLEDKAVLWKIVEIQASVLTCKRVKVLR